MDPISSAVFFANSSQPKIELVAHLQDVLAQMLIQNPIAF
jgi:hypothetical protein